MKGNGIKSFLDLNLPLDDKLPVRKEAFLNSQWSALSWECGESGILYADSSDLIENSGR